MNRGSLARALAALALAAAAAATACAPQLRRFPLAPAMARDDDTRPFAPRPPRREPTLAWDFIDTSVFQPVERPLTVPVARESTNVNALDEVPSSSWFDDRLARGEVTARALVDGACDAPPLDPARPWLVVDAKTDGVNPGFVVRGPDGARYMLKADGQRQTELTSAADAIASRLFWALGYNAPCNRVVWFDRATLRIDPAAAQTPRGGRPPVDEAAVARVLAHATRLPDGRYRMAASRFVEGEPLGPFTYEGRNASDPNDVVPHEDRRELRASRVAAAWLDHFDSRDQNTLAAWIPVRPRGGYVRHYLIDFGDCFGVVRPYEAMTARTGHAYSLDLGQIAEDFATLGLVVRPWDRAQVDGEAWVFGYFSSDRFDPEAWREIYPNPAFQRMTERDAAWMARRIARLDEPLVRVAVASGALSRPAWSEHLTRVLMERRRRVLARYLTRLSPLADVAVEGGALCATDLAAREGVLPGRGYRAVRYAGADLARRDALAVAPAPGRERARVCVALGDHVAPDDGARDDDPSRYVVVDVTGAARGDAPLRVHLYDLGPRRGHRLVGVERPEHAAPPRG